MLKLTIANFAIKNLKSNVIANMINKFQQYIMNECQTNFFIFMIEYQVNFVKII